MPWKDIASQPLVTRLFQRSLENRRIHHGYLLNGALEETEPIALGFAQALNCEKDNADFCGQCFSCKAIARGQHPDVYAVRPESRARRIVISQIRELERSVSLKASLARKKVAVIHDADRHQPESQDAFLKTLEEPPSSTVFLILTSDPQQLKDTVLSRCLRLNLRPPAQRRLSERQQEVEAALQTLARPPQDGEDPLLRAFGLSGRILNILKQSKSEKEEEMDAVLKDPAYENFEPAQRERFKDEAAAQAQAEYIRERGQLLLTMLEWCHAHLASARAVEAVEKLSQRLGRNVNESLAVEIAMLQLARPGA